jgi:hypothetical protein
VIAGCIAIYATIVLEVALVSRGNRDCGPFARGELVGGSPCGRNLRAVLGAVGGDEVDGDRPSHIANDHYATIFGDIAGVLRNLAVVIIVCGPILASEDTNVEGGVIIVRKVVGSVAKSTNLRLSRACIGHRTSVWRNLAAVALIGATVASFLALEESYIGIEGGVPIIREIVASIAKIANLSVSRSGVGYCTWVWRDLATVAFIGATIASLLALEESYIGIERGVTVAREIIASIAKIANLSVSRTGVGYRTWVWSDLATIAFVGATIASTGATSFLAPEKSSFEIGGGVAVVREIIASVAEIADLSVSRAAYRTWICCDLAAVAFIGAFVASATPLLTPNNAIVVKVVASVAESANLDLSSPGFGNHTRVYCNPAAVVLIDGACRGGAGKRDRAWGRKSGKGNGRDSEAGVFHLYDLLISKQMEKRCENFWIVKNWGEREMDVEVNWTDDLENYLVSTRRSYIRFSREWTGFYRIAKEGINRYSIYSKTKTSIALNEVSDSCEDFPVSSGGRVLSSL